MGDSRVHDVTYGITALLMLIGMAYKLARAGRSIVSRRVSYALASSIGFLAAAVILQISAVRHFVDIVGERHSAVLAAETLAMAALCSYQIALLLINDPNDAERKRGLRRRVLASVASVAAVAALGGLSSSPTYPGMSPPQRDPFGFTMEAVFVVYVGHVSADVARLALRFARLGGDRNLLRLSMYGMAVNAFVSLTYAVVKLIFLVLLTLVGTAVLEIQYAVTLPLVVTSALLVVVFATLPSWGRLVGGDRVAAWFGRYITFLTLYPLWHTLAVDRSTLHRRSRWADRLLPTDIDWRLTRRIIEIYDGLVALAPYRDPEAYLMALTIGRERGLVGDELGAAAEAASIAVATDARRLGMSRPARDQPKDEAPQYFKGDSCMSGTVSIADDVTWLTHVTDAYERSPVVRAVRRRRGPPSCRAWRSSPDDVSPRAHRDSSRI